MRKRENKFLDISLRDSKVKARKASIITSTNDLKRILKAAHGGWEEFLEKAIQALPENLGDADELVKTLRDSGCSEKTIRTALKLYGLRT